MEYELDPWDADIIKRTLGTKETDNRKPGYEKIIHIAEERIRPDASLYGTYVIHDGSMGRANKVKNMYRYGKWYSRKYKEVRRIEGSCKAPYQISV